ncbi:MAG: serine hydroxymethyltransferase, partial [Desulfatiglandales bacterium]
GGIILAKEEFGKALSTAVFPGTVSNHHLHHLAGLAIALAEMLEFGEAYADQIIKNAKALAQALYELGFDVLCEPKGFTESHQVVADVSKVGGGTHVATTLEKSNIIINKNLLPWDDLLKTKDPSGIRLGTQELTRLGMGESEMQEIAGFYKRLIIDKEKGEKVKNDVIELKKGFKKVEFSFDGREPYEYFKFF